MSELSDLYHEMILDHGKRPRNKRPIEAANRHAEGYNPLCGDHVEIFARVDDHDHIDEITFTGVGCAICTASASLMTESLRDRSVVEARAMFIEFQHMLRGDAEHADLPERLLALGGVKRYPMRVKCATLPWHTMKAALEDRKETVSTE